MNDLGQALLPHLIVVCIYLAVAIDFWRGAKITTSEQSFKRHSAMIALGLMIHGWLLYQDIFGETFAKGLNLGFFNAVSLIFWLTVLIYWLADLTHKLSSLQALVLPSAAIFSLLPAFCRQQPFYAESKPRFVSAHWHCLIGV